jgi:hypothetical protein
MIELNRMRGEAQVSAALSSDRHEDEVAKWQAIFDHRKERVQAAIDADEGIDVVTQLALEARAAQLDVDMVRRFGRPLNRQERRRHGVTVKFP